MCGDVEKWQKSKHIVRYDLLEYKKNKNFISTNSAYSSVSTEEHNVLKHP